MSQQISKEKQNDPVQRGLVRVTSLSCQRLTTPPNIGETNHRKGVVDETHDNGNTMG